MRLKTPSMPFEPLHIHGESITIDVDATDFIIPTGNQNALPSVNEFTQNPNRITTAPCGGLKDSIVQDQSPGALSIEGEGCYLQTTDGTYTGKTIGAGKLSETSSIIDSGSTGITLATADGIEVLMGDGNSILLRPPSAIVEEFQVVNISSTSETYTITLKSPDSIESIELYNLTSSYKENVSFTKISINEYTFSKSIYSNTTESFQLTIIYNSLEYTQIFSDDANITIGLENMSESWIAWLPKTGTDIDFFHFTERPKQLSYKQAPDGTITQITIYPGNGNTYYGRITHPDHTRVSGSGYIPDVFNKNTPGSITKFLQAHGMKTDFPSDATLTTWVVPAISDEKILPLSTISNDYLGDSIGSESKPLRMCPGEYGCASFVVQSDTDINLKLEADNNETLKIDPKYIKCWYQGGIGYTNYAPTGYYLTPELLLNDDMFVISTGDVWSSSVIPNENGENYIKLVDGTYLNISTNSAIPTPSNINETDYLQCCNLPKNYKKQIWVSIHISEDATPGNYSKKIILTNNNHVLKNLTVNITILPFELKLLDISPSLVYRARLVTESNKVSPLYKSVEQFTTDMRDIKEHGILNPTIKTQSSLNDVDTILSIRESLGMDNSIIFYSGLNIYSEVNDLLNFKNLAMEHGATSVYVYGVDESDLTTPERKALISTVHENGLKVFCAQSISQAESIADLLDLVQVAESPDTSLAALYHNYTSFDGEKHKIYSYANPQSVPELPRIFRLNYGFLLWKNDYDGPMDFTYQFEPSDKDTKNIWNDFDDIIYRDHCFTYPTLTKPIDTIQWEGYREAVNDMRYIATLEAAITEAQSKGIITTDIETWRDTLKTTDLSNADLDDIRSQIIDYILLLQNTETYRAVLMVNGDAICFENGQQLFVRE